MSNWPSGKWLSADASWMSELDVRAAQSGHSHLSGKKQHWYKIKKKKKIRSAEKHPPPDLADGVWAQPHQKLPAHSSSRCTELLPKLQDSCFQQWTTRQWGKKIKDELDRKITSPDTGLAVSTGNPSLQQAQSQREPAKNKTATTGLCRVQMSSTLPPRNSKPSISAASPRDNTSQE